jgi:hypothetical protein
METKWKRIGNETQTKRKRNENEKQTKRFVNDFSYKRVDATINAKQNKTKESETKHLIT